MTVVATTEEMKENAAEVATGEEMKIGKVEKTTVVATKETEAA